MRRLSGLGLLAGALVAAVACGGGAGSASAGRSEGRAGAGGATAQALPGSIDAVAVEGPAARARAGGWSGASLAPPPRYCDEQGGTEWCDGARDDDCDGEVDEGCADCVHQECVRFEIDEEHMGRGSGRAGTGQCIGPIHCGRIDGYATTTPPGGCGEFHCGTVLWADGTAQPFHCTVYGRCVGGVFVAKGFTW